MSSFVIGLFGDMIAAIIGADIFAPVLSLFLFSLGLGFLLALRR